MKVMYVCTTGGSQRRQLGGAERILADLIPAVAERGVEVLACTSDDAVADALRASGVAWVGAEASRRIDPAYAKRIGELVDSFAPDVVCAHLLSAAMHARAAMTLSRRRTRLVVTMHNSLWQYRDTAASRGARLRARSNLALDATLRRVRPHASVAVSAFEADHLRRLGRVKDVHVIPNPLPPVWPDDAPAALRAPGEPPRVGFLGRHETEKGIDYLGSVAALMPDARFLVAGEGSRTPAATANLEPVGRVDAAKFLADLDVLLVPSTVESFGLSALEALSLGVPVVHSGAGGLAEVTRAADGVLAHRVALEPGALAAGIRAALAPVPAERRRAVAERYRAEYAFPAFVDRWHRLYQGLVA